MTEKSRCALQPWAETGAGDGPAVRRGGIQVVLVHHPSHARTYADFVQKAFPDLDVRTSMTAEEAERRVPEADAILAWRFPADLFAKAHRLRWVQSMGAGVEDLLAADGLAQGVRLTRVVDQFGPTIAEYVFAELLARVRHLEHARTLQARHEWQPYPVETLAGGVLGVAGLGSIGQEIVRKGRAFDMGVVGLSRTGKRAGTVDRHFGPGEWIRFAEASDVMVLTLPLTTATQGVVNERVLSALPVGAILVNVGRGALVRETDLVAALRAGRLAGAILDVFEKEPLSPKSPLWDLPGVTVTPHVSGPSRAADVCALFVENFRRLERGEELIGEVDRVGGY